MTALYCPHCEHTVEARVVEDPAIVPHGELNTYADIVPGETFYQCECGCSDVDYTDVCDICGSAEDVIRGEDYDICDACLSRLAEDSERFERFLTAKGLSMDFYFNFIYDSEVTTSAEDMIAFEILDIVRTFVHSTNTACDFAVLAKEYLSESVVDDAVLFIKAEREQGTEQKGGEYAKAV